MEKTNAADWPYNDTLSSKISGPVIDYGPKITTCVTEVQLGGSSGSSSAAASGSGAAASAESAPSVSISAPSASGDAYNPDEAKNFLESRIDNIQSIDDGYLVRLHLANSGEKDMILSTGLEDNAEHSYLVIRKTTGLPAWSGIRYSENSPDANLLKSQMEGGDEIVLPPGETKELDLKIKSGLVAKPREIKVQVKSFGEVVKENGMTLEKVSQTGAALDHLRERHALDMYLVVSTETTSISSDGFNLNPDSHSDLLTGGSIANPLVDLIASNNHDTYLLEFNLVKKKEASGFLNLMSGIGKSAVVTDVYGPYKIEKEDGFVFAQQIYYDPLVHNGEHEINTKLIKNGEVVTENSFDIVLEGENSEKNNSIVVIIILLILILAVILMFGVIIYLLITRKGKL